MTDNLIYFILFAIAFSFFSIINTRYLSNLISQLTIYHTNENLCMRVRKVIRVYLFLGLPSFFLVFFLLNEIVNSSFFELVNSTSNALVNSTSNLTSTSNIEAYSNDELFLISSSMSFIIPFVTRVASLTKRPIPFECKKCIEYKTIGKNFLEKHKYITQMNCMDNENDSRSDEDLIKCKNIWNTYRERTVSFAYSILGGVFVFMLFLLLLFISNIFDKIKSIEDFQISQFLLQFSSEYIISIKIPLGNLSYVASYLAIVYTSLVVIALSGEILIFLLGGVSEFYMEGEKTNYINIYQRLKNLLSKLGGNRFFNKKPSK
jgi:hypothetical protein